MPITIASFSTDIVPLCSSKDVDKVCSMCYLVIEMRPKKESSVAPKCYVLLFSNLHMSVQQ